MQNYFYFLLKNVIKICPLHARIGRAWESRRESLTSCVVSINCSSGESAFKTSSLSTKLTGILFHPIEAKVFLACHVTSERFPVATWFHSFPLRNQRERILAVIDCLARSLNENWSQKVLNFQRVFPTSFAYLIQIYLTEQLIIFLL